MTNLKFKSIIENAREIMHFDRRRDALHYVSTGDDILCNDPACQCKVLQRNRETLPAAARGSRNSAYVNPARLKLTTFLTGGKDEKQTGNKAGLKLITILLSLTAWNVSAATVTWNSVTNDPVRETRGSTPKKAQQTTAWLRLPPNLSGTRQYTASHTVIPLERGFHTVSTDGKRIVKVLIE